MNRKRVAWILVIVVLAAAGWCYHSLYWRKTDVAAVRQLLEQHIAVGMPADSVARALDSLRIEHSTVDAKDGHMSAIIRNTSQAGVVLGDMLIRLQFDAHGRLTQFTVEEAFTGP